MAAADNVDLAVAQGEFVTILGPSGSGKTTLLSLIAGLNKPTPADLHRRPRCHRGPAQGANRPGVPVLCAVPAHDGARERPVSAGRAQDHRRADTHEALEALKLVRLDGLQDRRPSQLSGGQQQRVALARAIVFKPDILLLDEPLGALDRKLREEMQVELKQLQRTLGVTTMLVSHDQEEALSLRDRIMVLNQGKYPAGRGAGRGLSQARQPLRGGVPGDRQFHRHRWRADRSGAARGR